MRSVNQAAIPNILAENLAKNSKPKKGKRKTAAELDLESSFFSNRSRKAAGDAQFLRLFRNMIPDKIDVQSIAFVPGVRRDAKIESAIFSCLPSLSDEERYKLFSPENSILIHFNFGNKKTSQASMDFRNAETLRKACSWFGAIRVYVKPNEFAIVEFDAKAMSSTAFPDDSDFGVCAASRFAKSLCCGRNQFAFPKAHTGNVTQSQEMGYHARQAMSDQIVVGNIILPRSISWNCSFLASREQIRFYWLYF